MIINRKELQYEFRRLVLAPVYWFVRGEGKNIKDYRYTSLSKSGRQQKLGRILLRGGCLIFIVISGICILIIVLLLRILLRLL
jgi:hypothetical protein